jgi:hypothetical protein
MIEIKNQSFFDLLFKRDHQKIKISIYYPNNELIKNIFIAPNDTAQSDEGYLSSASG